MTISPTTSMSWLSLLRFTLMRLSFTWGAPLWVPEGAGTAGFFFSPSAAGFFSVAGAAAFAAGAGALWAAGAAAGAAGAAGAASKV